MCPQSLAPDDQTLWTSFSKANTKEKEVDVSEEAQRVKPFFVLFLTVYLILTKKTISRWITSYSLLQNKSIISKKYI